MRGKVQKGIQTPTARLHTAEGGGPDSRVPWGVEALAGAVTVPAWKHKPSYYLVAADDRMIPPPAQRMMAERAGAKTIETAGSHAVYVSKPEAVADLIVRAANG